MNLAVHVDNREKYILILGKDTAQALDNTTLTVMTAILKLGRHFEG